ncbi:MAG TPA: gliding motility-associated C-terminal domain-containing protein, partial [Chitinophagales bacterium]|nr:gliding motility-associated C-terminal domain-containing protein [Chitinophagales bacterium]
PLTTTTYQVTVTDENGCRNQDTALVQVTPRECSEKLIFIPNAFTPNGDGANDTFRVRSEILTEMILKIYDRWGNEVFYTNNITDGWDGQYKGAAAPPDVYGFTMSGTCLENKKIVIKGNITLLR